METGVKPFIRVRNVRVKETACKRVSDQDWKRRVMETACKRRGIESAGKKPPVKLEVS